MIFNVLFKFSVKVCQLGGVQEVIKLTVVFVSILEVLKFAPNILFVMEASDMEEMATQALEEQLAEVGVVGTEEAEV